MSKALLPFYALYVGDGSSVAFTLDVSKDPFYHANDVSAFGTGNALPGTTTLAGTFDFKIPLTAVINVQAQNVANGTDFGPVSTSISQYQLTFTLTTAPPAATKFAIQGFFEY
jgi:hypothetical protein